MYDCLPRGKHRKYNRNNDEGVSCISEAKYPSMPQAPNNTRRTGHQFGHRLGNTVRKGRLFFQHQLNINSVRIQSSNQWIYSSRSAIFEESFQCPRTTLVIWRDILAIPWLPGRWLLGLIRNPGLWAPCSPCTPVLDCRSIRYTLRGIHFGRHSTGEFEMYIIIYNIEHGRWKGGPNRIVNTRNTWRRKPDSGLPALRPWLTTGTIHGLQGFLPEVILVYRKWIELTYYPIWPSLFFLSDTTLEPWCQTNLKLRSTISFPT
jgi:hypothetical protein